MRKHKRIICTWHSDPGHAWLSVPKSLLVKLGIAEQITQFSYSNGNRAYLEEDCDASLFLRVATLEPLEIRTGKHTRSYSRVRYYERYRTPIEISKDLGNLYDGWKAKLDLQKFGILEANLIG